MVAAAGNVAAAAALYTDVPLAPLTDIILASADVLLAGAPTSLTPRPGPSMVIRI